ncbi:type IV pilus biogenesis protein PilM [Jeotgalibacillus sp. JSM ZJ347]|uniref:type IV pilus biogenesis protein PilM n=1 Tax=Jeotgalibacillus sp. JSM ZJ347 TaxID=3342117 RepID=UPI0035A92593
MLKSLLSRSDQFVHIVFSEEAIRMVELKSLNPLDIKQVQYYELPEGIIQRGKIEDAETLESILEQCVRDWKIKRKKVQFTVPDHYVIVRQIELKENLSDQEIHGYLYMELGNRIQLPFDDPVFDFVKLPGDNKRNIIIFASPVDVVSSYRDLFDKASLEPLTADITPLSLYRYYQHTGTLDQTDHLMFLHMEPSQLTVSVFHNGFPLFMRPIDLWDIEFEELYSEIEKIMRFYQYSVVQDDGEIGKIYLSGDHSDVEDFHQGLSDTVRVKVEKPFITREINHLDIDPKGFEVAIGLALKEGLR